MIVRTNGIYAYRGISNIEAMVTIEDVKRKWLAEQPELVQTILNKYIHGANRPQVLRDTSKLNPSSSGDLHSPKLN
jgi:hypothetical protein